MRYRDRKLFKSLTLAHLSKVSYLASAGNTLEGADAELVLNPLRLAFETKNLKILESALDCLHVRACFLESDQ